MGRIGKSRYRDKYAPDGKYSAQPKDMAPSNYYKYDYRPCCHLHLWVGDEWRRS